jgi:hypothetical protein
MGVLLLMDNAITHDTPFEALAAIPELTIDLLSRPALADFAWDHGETVRR